MATFSVKSILLGIGIGMITTSVLSIVYMAGSDLYTGKYSKKQEKVIIQEENKQSTVVEDKAVVYESAENNKSKATESNQPKQNVNKNASKPSVNNGEIYNKNIVEKKEPKIEMKNNNSEIIKAKKESSTGEDVNFQIVSGDTSEKVAKRLQNIGVIKDEKAFVEKLHAMDLENKIQIKKYKFFKKMNDYDVIKAITTSET